MRDLDVLDSPDLVSLDDLTTPHTSSMNRAGMDDLTPVDTFLRANGDYVYITQDFNPDEELT